MKSFPRFHDLLRMICFAHGALPLIFPDSSPKRWSEKEALSFLARQSEEGFSLLQIGENNMLPPLLASAHKKTVFM